MATVVNLEAEPLFLCPNRRAEVTATTDPPEAIVDWFIDDEPVDPNDPPDNTDVDGNVLRLGARQGQVKKIEARIDGSAMTIRIEGKVASMRVEFTPAPAGGMHVISSEPAMPDIAMQISAGGALVGDVTVTFVANDCPPNGPADLRTAFTVPGGGPGPLQFGDVVVGGSLGARAEGVVNGCLVGGSGGADIGGTNPPRTEIQAALPNKTLRRIACKESGQRQFDAPADGGVGRCPLFGPGGRVGVMQLPDPTPDEVWNWRSNIAGGMRRLEEKVAEAAAYPGRVRSSAAFEDLVAEFNAGRLQAGLSALTVTLPDFPSGDFDDNLQELELDAVRGYDGWFGGDGLGHELHEYRVGTELGIPERLIVTDVDEVARTGRATWERVGAGDRPAVPGDPDYVAAVMGFLPSCDGDGEEELFPCRRVTVTTTGPALGFNPPSSTTGDTVIEGKVDPNTLTLAMRWCERPADKWRGTAVIEQEVVGNVVRATLHARHPGKMQMRLRRGACGSGLSATCYTNVKLSVPHFFFLSFLDAFDTDLTRLGLRRSSPLTAEQDAANKQARQAVIDIAVKTAVNHFPRVNVRFVTASPAAAVGVGNFTTINIGGMTPPNSNNTEYGFCVVNFGDLYNPEKPSGVFAGEFAHRVGPIPGDPRYRAIFDPLATEDAGGGALPGVPVDAGEVVTGPPATPRQMIVRAAVTAFGRFIGTVAAHEAGHALIPSVSATDLFGVHEQGTLMMDGGATFVEDTGIVGFDAAALQLNVVEPLSFGPWFRKRLVSRYPTEDIELSEYD